MLLLAIDTSGTGVTVAVHDPERALAEHSSQVPRKHAELLAPAIRDVLAEAGLEPRDLTGLAVGIGPGPFTGLRAGVVTARVLGLTWQLPVHGVCSLDALAGQLLDAAQGAGRGAGAARGIEVGERFVVATDARRSEVYWATYQVGDDGSGPAAVRVEGPEVAAPDDVPRAGLLVGGRGAALYPEVLGPVALRTAAPGSLEPGPPGPDVHRPVLDVTGAGVARLAVRRILSGAPDDGVEPLYLRRPDAAIPGARKRVLQ